MICGVALYLKTKDSFGDAKETSLYCQLQLNHEGSHWTHYSVGNLGQNVVWKGRDVEITN